MTKFVACLAVNSSCIGVHAQGMDSSAPHKPTVVMIDYQKGKQGISIDGQPTLPSKVLFRLGAVRGKSADDGTAQAAMVLAHERTPIHDLLSMHVVSSKRVLATFGTSLSIKKRICSN